MVEKVSVRMDIGHGHACWRVRIFGFGKQRFGGEGGCCFAQNTLQWLPSKEEDCNFLAVSLSLPDFNCLWQRTLAALQFDELQS